MKTYVLFIFWISFSILFPQGLHSKSLTNKEQYGSDSGSNSNENSEVDVENDAVALHETFRPRHKYKANGHQTRVHRSDSDKDIEIKTPQCAVMYKDNEPVGILQPFKDSYKFIPISGEPTLVDINPIPVKRKTIMDVLYPSKINEDYNEEIVENNNQFADDRYPSIFAKFKIDSRLDKSVNPDLNLKRSMFKRATGKPDTSNVEESAFKSPISKVKRDNSGVVEEKLKNILDDMGLIDDYTDKEEAKREIAEDENMEQGTNKINLVKEVHNETRNKRGEANDTVINERSTPPATTESNNDTTDALPKKLTFKDENAENAESIDLFHADEAKLDDSENEDSDISTEGKLEDERKKRQFEENCEKNGNSKGDKRDTSDTLPDTSFNTSSLVKEAELNQYEKRVEREIRDKIQKLKEEVKEEIKYLKDNPKVMKSEESDTRRRKRQVVNSLLDEETQDIDPNLNDEMQNVEHHVRRKRSNDFDKSNINEPKFKRSLSFNETSDNNEIYNNTISPNSFKILESNSNKNSNKIPKENKNELRSVTDFGVYPEVKKTTEKLNDHTIEIKINKVKRDDQGLCNYQIHHNCTEKDSNTLETTNKTLHNINCTDISCPICKLHNRNEHGIENEIRDASNNFSNSNSVKMKTGKKISRTRSISKNTDVLKSKNITDETKRKKNIIKILNVIGEKKYKIKNNPYNRKLKTDSCTNCQIDIKHDHEGLKQVADVDASSAIQNKSRNSPPSPISTLNYPLAIRDEEVVDYNVGKMDILKPFPINSNLEPYDKKLDENKLKSITRIRRFVGINPILKNLRNFTNQSNHYLSRNLKQLDDEANEINVENKVHIRVKRSDDDNGGTATNNSNSEIHYRRRRQFIDDLDDDAYQYDESEFGENGDNQMYDDQPFDNENDNMSSMDSNSAVSNIKSSCNCDKSDTNCKCGTQKADLSVPNIKQDYSDYMINPSNLVEKKSVNHCNCDKNGKHCKCQAFEENSQYSEYGEDQPSSVEKTSGDQDDEAINDDFQGEVKERTPRRSRQKRRHNDISIRNSNTQDLADDYESEDETKLMKRETKSKKPTGNQQFQNGEYFLDMHPDIYRLTPVDPSREKRDTFKDLVAIHGGGPVLNHLVAIKQRSMLPHPRLRRRVQNDDNRELRQLIDMSDEDLFGALPQSFAGELARYKRVKRNKNEK